MKRLRLLFALPLLLLAAIPGIRPHVTQAAPAHVNYHNCGEYPNTVTHLSGNCVLLFHVGPWYQDIMHYDIRETWSHIEVRCWNASRVHNLGVDVEFHNNKYPPEYGYPYGWNNVPVLHVHVPANPYGVESFAKAENHHDIKIRFDSWVRVFSPPDCEYVLKVRIS